MAGSEYAVEGRRKGAKAGGDFTAVSSQHSAQRRGEIGHGILITLTCSRLERPPACTI